MKLMTFILLLSVEMILAEYVCRYPSISNPPLPLIKKHRMPPQGPRRDPRMPCPLPSHCDLTSCSFSFNKSPYSCDTDCHCVNPCDRQTCYGNQVCVVLKAPDNGNVAFCISKPEASKCPKIHCPLSSCVYGYESDTKGCETCECKHPCKNLGCMKGSVCQMLKLTPGSDVKTPECVVCPKLVNCHKTGLCKGGLKKDSRGCDVCECESCNCPSTTTPTPTNGNFPYDDRFIGGNGQCSYNNNNCADYLEMNATSGCDVCRCETLPCWDKCGGHEICDKRYTTYGRLYGVCIPKPPLCGAVSCDSTKCPNGLQVDYNGCVLADCSCRNPCDHHKCPTNSYCQLGFCPENSKCPPPYCTECMDVMTCGNTCSNGRMLDTNGCKTCECKQKECKASSACRGMYCPYGHAMDRKTGCEICMCVNSPCHISPCEVGHVCVVGVKDGRHVAVCNGPPPPTKECPPFNCDHVKCPVGLERDEDGCVMNNCQCKDLCKDYQCQAGSRCVMQNGCTDSSLLCRDGYMRSCVEINSLETTTLSTTTTTTARRQGQGGNCVELEYCASWCKQEVDSKNCQVCICPAVPDRCLNYKCPPGLKCVMSKSTCTGPNCRDAPMRACVEIGSLPTPATTPRPVCSIPKCSKPCSLVYPSSLSSNPCPFCQCPSDCQSTQCDAGKVCGMVYQANCYSDCAKIPRCIEERPGKCFIAKAEGSLCLDTPVKQWYYDQATKRCELFYYNGCDGNANRFPSMDSCQSSCQEMTFNCLSNNTCSLSCPHGFKLDSNDCKLCQCVDPCESTTCPSSNMACKVHVLPCPARQPSCHLIHVPSCVCSKGGPCEITCPYGKVKDAGGCDTCDCFDPCQNVKCGDQQLCSIAYHESCKDKSCSSEVKGECVDALMKKNMRIRVNASYDIYILNDMTNYNGKIRNSISNYYNVPTKNVYILKHEKGSIITTAEVLIDNEDSQTDVELNSFDLSLGNHNFTASVVSEKEWTPTKEGISNDDDGDGKLSKINLIIIILMCVGVPLCLSLVGLAAYLICKCRNRNRFNTINRPILSSYPSTLSDTFPKSPPVDFQPSKELEIKQESVEALKEKRIKSFTEI